MGRGTRWNCLFGVANYNFITSLFFMLPFYVMLLKGVKYWPIKGVNFCYTWWLKSHRKFGGQKFSWTFVVNKICIWYSMISYSSGTSFIICGKCLKKFHNFPRVLHFLFFLLFIYLLYVQLLPLRTKDSFLIINETKSGHPCVLSLPLPLLYTVENSIIHSRGSIHFPPEDKFNPNNMLKIINVFCFVFVSMLKFFLCLML